MFNLRKALSKIHSSQSDTAKGLGDLNDDSVTDGNSDPNGLKGLPGLPDLGSTSSFDNPWHLDDTSTRSDGLPPSTSSTSPPVIEPKKHYLVGEFGKSKEDVGGGSTTKKKKHGKSSSSARSQFSPFLAGMAGITLPPAPPPVTNGTTANPTPSEDGSDFFPSMIRRQVPPQDGSTDASPLPSPPISGDEEAERSRRRRRQQQMSSFSRLQSLQSLQTASESSDPASPQLYSSPSGLDGEDSIAKRLEEAARQARLKAAKSFAELPKQTPEPVPPPKLNIPVTPSPPVQRELSPPPLPSKLDSPAAEPIPLLEPIPDKMPEQSDDIFSNGYIYPFGDGEELHDTLAALARTVKHRPDSNVDDNADDDNADDPSLPSPPPDNPNLFDDPQDQTPLDPPIPTPPFLRKPSSEPDGLKANTTTNVDTPLDPETDIQPPSPPVPPSAHSPQDELEQLREALRKSQAKVEKLGNENVQLRETVRDEQLGAHKALKRLDNERLRAVNDVEHLRKLNTKLSEENRSLQAIARKHGEELDDVLDQLKATIEENDHLNKELSSLRKRTTDLKHKEAKYKAVLAEKDGWQTQIDLMQNKISSAEQRVRCLDELTRLKFEARQDGTYGGVGRSSKLHHSPHVKGPSTEIIESVTTFNEEVLQTANLLVENLERVTTKNGFFAVIVGEKEHSRARKLLGERVTSLLDKQAVDSANPNRFGYLLMQNCLEVFFTYWSVQIIEAWYPHQPSFSDLLVELVAAQTNKSYQTTLPQQICGKQLQVLRTQTTLPEFKHWVDEILEDLSSILRVGGCRMRQQKSDLFHSKLLHIVKLAYNLRLALAEKDICGGLELSAPSPDVPFNSDSMAEEHALERRMKNGRVERDWAEDEAIAGTNAVGLKRTANGRPTEWQTVVKPKVVLVRVLEDPSNQ